MAQWIYFDVIFPNLLKPTEDCWFMVIWTAFSCSAYSSKLPLFPLHSRWWNSALWASTPREYFHQQWTTGTVTLSNTGDTMVDTWRILNHGCGIDFIYMVELQDKRVRCRVCAILGKGVASFKPYTTPRGAAGWVPPRLHHQPVLKMKFVLRTNSSSKTWEFANFPIKTHLH